MAYGYLVWVMLLCIIWIIGYATAPALRKKILWSSFIALPFGLGELYFFPDYWAPQTLFNFGARYGVAVESFALMFFLGGIAAFIYEEIFKKHISQDQKFCHPQCRCYLSFTAALVAFIVILKAFPVLNIVYTAAIACLAGGVAAFLLYPKLRVHILLGGLTFAIIYLVSLAIAELFVPGWIASAWNMTNLSGITVLAVPIEEILFGFSFGTLWTPLSEEVCSNFNSKNH